MQPIQILQTLYDYTAQNDDELSFYENQLLYVLEIEDDEWAKCLMKVPNEENRVGVVPRSYLGEPEPLYHAVALYDYTAQTDDELTIYENSQLEVLDEEDDEWLLVQMRTNEGVYFGVVPKSYVSSDSNGNTTASNGDDVDGAAIDDSQTYGNGTSPTNVPQIQITDEVIPNDILSIPVMEVVNKKKKKTGRSGVLGIGTDGCLYFADKVTGSILSKYDANTLSKYNFKSKEKILKLEFSGQTVEFLCENKVDAESLVKQIGDVTGKQESGGSKWFGSVKKSKSQQSQLSELGKDSSGKDSSNSSLPKAQVNRTPTTTSPVVLPSPPIPVPVPVAVVKPTPSYVASSAAPPPIAPSPALLAGGNPPKIATALYDFEPGADEELDIREGENLIVIDDSDESWWKVKIVSSKKDRSGREGFVPSSYVELKVAAAVEKPQPDDSNAREEETRRRMQEEEDRRREEERRRIQEEDRRRKMEEEAARQAAAQPPALPTRKASTSSTASSKSSGPPKLPTRSARKPSDTAAPPPLAPRPVSVASNRGVTSPTLPVAVPPPTLPKPERKKSLKDDQTTKAAVPTDSSAKKLPDPAKVRPWLDASGTHSVEAEFLDFEDGKVKLFKTNGIKINVPIDKLSPEDQEIVYRLKGIPMPKAATPVVAVSTVAATVNSPPPLATKPATPNVSSPASSNSVTGTVYNNFDWYDYLTKIGISHSDAMVYSRKFVQERMDSTILPDLTRDVLKGLEVAEGDIIRIRKAVDRASGVTSPPAIHMTGSSNVTTPSVDPKIAEREKQLQAKNLERIDSYVAAKLQSQEVSTALMEKQQQILRDEQLARELHQKEMMAMKSGQGGSVSKSTSSSLLNKSDSFKSKTSGTPVVTSEAMSEIQQRLTSTSLSSQPSSNFASSSPANRPMSAMSNVSSLTNTSSSAISFPVSFDSNRSNSSVTSPPLSQQSGPTNMNFANFSTQSFTPPVNQPPRPLPPSLIPTPVPGNPAQGFVPTNPNQVPTLAGSDPNVRPMMPRAMNTGMGPNPNMNMNMNRPNMMPNQMPHSNSIDSLSSVGARGLDRNISSSMGTINSNLSASSMGSLRSANSMGNVNAPPGSFGPTGPGNMNMGPGVGNIPVTVSSSGRGANWMNATPDNPFGIGRPQTQQPGQMQMGQAGMNPMMNTGMNMQRPMMAGFAGNPNPGDRYSIFKEVDPAAPSIFNNKGDFSGMNNVGGAWQPPVPNPMMMNNPQMMNMNMQNQNMGQGQGQNQFAGYNQRQW